MLIVCGLGASSILRGALSLYENVISYSVETNYLNFETPFPPMTVCELSDDDKINDYITKHNLPPTLFNFYKDVSYWNSKYCKSCATCTDKTCREDFAHVVAGVRRNCTELFSGCWWGGRRVDCCEKFLPIETEYGKCFVFNSRLTNDTVLMVSQGTSLSAIMFRTMHNIEIWVHSPDEMVSVNMDYVLSPQTELSPITTFETILKAEETVSDVSLRAFSAKDRGCLFKDEVPESADLWPYPNKYSYGSCVFYCKAIAQVQKCNCTHHFMPKLEGVPVCDIKGMACLYKKKDSISAYKCDCPMACDEVVYKVVHISNKRVKDNIPAELRARGNQVTMRLAQLPTLRVRRHAIREVLNLVVDIGGVGGVFFGASLLSVIEIVYLFCIRRKP